MPWHRSTPRGRALSDVSEDGSMLITHTAALVTGGASGLGAATAETLAAAGSAVYAVDLPSALDDAALVDGVTYVAADVTDGAQVQWAVDQAVAGGVPLRTVVSCAGIAPSMRILGRSGPHDLDVFARVVQVNLCGTFNVMTLGAAAMAWVLRDSDASARVVLQHEPAAVGFSLITIAFHLFFLACIAMPLVNGNGLVLAVAAFAVCAALAGR